MAADARALVESLARRPVHVVGHSLGGLIALKLALDSRRLVRSLALLCTFASGRQAGASLRMLWLGARTRLGTRAMRRRAFLEISLPGPDLVRADRDRLASDLASVVGHDLADHPAIEGRQLAAMRACDLSGALPSLAGVPTLVVSAAHDPIAPPALGEAIARAIPRSRFVLLPDAAHAAPIYSRQLVNDLLMDHLTLASGSPTPRPDAGVTGLP